MHFCTFYKKVPKNFINYSASTVFRKSVQNYYCTLFLKRPNKENGECLLYYSAKSDTA